MKLGDVVTFRGDHLFEGAVSLDWFTTDERLRTAAAEAFIFHGPTYHGVSQGDVGLEHGHLLQDTATFARSIVHACYDAEPQPFALAIAGYGTGKSHLALALATLLSDPTSPTAAAVLTRLESADAAIGAEVRATLAQQPRPALVVALNGMRSFDLTSELTQQVADRVRAHGLSADALDELRPRFAQAANLVSMSDAGIVADLLAASNLPDRESILQRLRAQDEHTYAQVYHFYEALGMPIRSLGGESISDLIDVVTRTYCGDGRPFGRLLILFDEFGRYTEFATERSQIAGSGVLQDLFEGVQAHAVEACFVGFVQFELNAYVQRVAPELRNEIVRYVTRYQSAKKSYLSTNLETLIASLMEKRQPAQLAQWLDGPESAAQSRRMQEQIGAWYPQSAHYRLWNDQAQFHTVIRKGCWPLSPYSTWLLFYLTAAGKHLQERSALTLLGEALARHGDSDLDDEVGRHGLAPVQLWSEGLQEDLLTSEEGGAQGSITHAYASVEARHGAHLSDTQRRLLRAVVLSSKLGLNVGNVEEALKALSALTGLAPAVTKAGIEQLQREINVLEWDESFRGFSILGDAVPRTQFLAFLRRAVGTSFDVLERADLFVRRAPAWCDLLGDVNCDFGESNSILTREWHFEAVTSNAKTLEVRLRLATERCARAVAVDEARATVVYCYVEPNRDPIAVADKTARILRTLGREVGMPVPPVLVVLLADEEGVLGQALAELAVLEEKLSEEDKARFGNLIGAHKEKTLQMVRNHVGTMIKQQRYVTALPSELKETRIARVATELLTAIYKTPLPFPFDGFNTARGNAADDCQRLVSELLEGKLDYDGVINKSPRVKNRAIAVLNDSWRVFTGGGAVSRHPAHSSAKSIVRRWDAALQSTEKPFLIGHELRAACLPPFGANVASAALLFGVFVAPRLENLVIVRDGQQQAISTLLQDGAFQGRALDLAALQDIELTTAGETSSEWEQLLDEWETEASHYARVECRKRAYELEQRVPAPPVLRYRFLHFSQQAEAAFRALQEMEQAQDVALRNISRGEEHSDVSYLAWGASQLLSLQMRMSEEGAAWSDQQREEVTPLLERARQKVIQLFPEWLPDQTLHSADPADVSKYRHHMLDRLGRELKELKLQGQYEALDKHVATALRTVEAAAQAQQLVTEVTGWLGENAASAQGARMARLRQLGRMAKSYVGKLQTTAAALPRPDLDELRGKVIAFAGALKTARTALTTRATALWERPLQSGNDLEALLDEVERLAGAFEGCEKDLDDLVLMRRALHVYHRCYQQLDSPNITWEDFNSLVSRLEQESTALVGADEIPWPPAEVLGSFAQQIGSRRQEESTGWITLVEAEIPHVDEQSAAEANQLRMRLAQPPAVLTQQHRVQLAEYLGRVEARLGSLEVEGLIERFRALPAPSRQRFLELAQSVVRGE